jgi:hypothetical protein
VNLVHLSNVFLFRSARAGLARSAALAAVAGLAMAWSCVAAMAAATSSVVHGDAIAPATANALWSVDPAFPGADLPPAGRSLFDFLVMQGDAGRETADVPFPFSALVERIATPRRAGAHDAAPVRAVLIPLGRSLQRSAAAPDFFASPRVVVSFAGETRGPGGAEVALRDRLYFGYQPRANVIEVISYNEAAGRFEFQIVSDYRAGGRAKVRYARRPVCIACHQNGGPIFSRGLWSETNANPRIAAALLREKSRFEGVDVARGIDIPDAIDAAVRRANRMAGYQWLWRNGCAASATRDGEIRCRGQTLVAALRYRLSGRQSYDAAAPEYRELVRGAMAGLATAQRGAGLALPDPGLPNRDPLLDHAIGSRSANDYAAVADVAAAYDPLTPRPALEIWPFADPDFVARQLVAGIAEFFTDADVRRLGDQLRAAAAWNGAPRRDVTLACDIGVTRREAGQQRIAFACSAADAGTQRRAQLQGTLLVDGVRIYGGSVERLGFADDGAGTDALRNIAIGGGTFRMRRGEVVATLRVARDGTPVRRGDGHAVESIRLTWVPPHDAAKAAAPALRARGAATVTLLEDFAPIARAVSALERSTQEGTSDALSAQPFRRASVLAALDREIGLPPARWCCVDDRALPPPAVEERAALAIDAGEEAGEERVFHRYCALCHRSDDPAPPNFLNGTPAQVRANLAHCAQRLHVRLAMWERTGSERTKTPMPPLATLHGAGISESAWRSAEDLSTLRGYVAKLLRADGARQGGTDALLRANYEQLRECLPRAG